MPARPPTPAIRPWCRRSPSAPSGRGSIRSAASIAGKSRGAHSRWSRTRSPLPSRTGRGMPGLRGMHVAGLTTDKGLVHFLPRQPTSRTTRRLRRSSGLRLGSLSHQWRGRIVPWSGLSPGWPSARPSVAAASPSWDILMWMLLRCRTPPMSELFVAPERRRFDRRRLVPEGF